MLSSLDDPHKIIVVTSSVPGEGKTTVSISMAHSLAEIGKVLLIDADMRRPTIAKNVGLDKNHAGLSEYVTDTASLKDCIHKLEGTEVYVMPSGVVPPNPLELLSSQRFVQALEKLKSTFTNIIIDSAPALAVSDALVLSIRASGVVYVIKADATPRPIAQEGVKRLTRAGAHLIGGVLNSVVTKKGSKSKYGNYYGSYGYTSDE